LIPENALPKIKSVMKKILIADDIDSAGLKQLSRKKFYIKRAIGISNDEIRKKYGSYDVLVIRSIRKIDKEFLNSVSFKIIATGSKGTDHIDIKYAKTKSIQILNADDSNNISAAEHTLALILNIYKNIMLSDKLVRSGKFGYYNYKRSELSGKSIGIVGFGKVGSYVGKLCKAFGMEIYANDIDKKVRLQNPEFIFIGLKSLLRKCDIITIHIPLNRRNENFFSEEKLEIVKPRSVIINTSRGNVIDEDYLYELLKKKKIYFAGLDVMRNEPDADRRFFELDNVLLTNHIAGKTEESRKRVSENLFRSIKNYFSKAN